MTQQVRRIPDGYHAVTPYDIVEGAARFVGFMEKAFGATDRGQALNDDGTIGHAEGAEALDREIRGIGRRS